AAVWRDRAGGAPGAPPVRRAAAPVGDGADLDGDGVADPALPGQEARRQAVGYVGGARRAARAHGAAGAGAAPGGAAHAVGAAGERVGAAGERFGAAGERFGAAGRRLAGAGLV